MLGFFRRKKSLPELDGPIMEDIRIAVRLIQTQNEEFWGQERLKAPYTTKFQEICIAGYAFGLVNGIFQITKSPIAYSRGDENVEELGRLTAYVSILAGTFACADRLIAVSEQVPGFLMQPGAKPECFEELEKWGGTDGMAFTRDGKLSKGGYLLHFYRHNVSEAGKGSARWA
jgi:hypothetical protein